MSSSLFDPFHMELCLGHRRDDRVCEVIVYTTEKGRLRFCGPVTVCCQETFFLALVCLLTL